MPECVPLVCVCVCGVLGLVVGSGHCVLRGDQQEVSVRGGQWAVSDRGHGQDLQVCRDLFGQSESQPTGATEQKR